MTQRTTPQKLLVDWANQQDAWVRLIVAEALSFRQSLGDETLATIYDVLVREKELTTGAPVSVPQLKVAVTSADKVERLELVKLADVAGVNALTGGATIDFSPKLTVLFGENAAGKSGYVRIIKRVAAVRSQEEVLPNVKAGATPAALKATISYRLGEAETPYPWKGETGASPFTRISVFDTRATRFHLDEDLSYSYTPRDLSLFRVVHAAIENVRERLEAAKKNEQPPTNPFTTLFAKGTRIYPKVETLGSHSDVTELQKLSVVSAEEEGELEGLRASVDALRSEASKARLETAKSDRDLYSAIATAIKEICSFESDKYRDAVTAVQNAERRHLDATRDAFAGLDLPGALRPEWTAFVQAGEAYIRVATSQGYPDENAPCVYCRQPLEVAAVDLIQKYREFTNSNAKQDLDRAITARDVISSRFRSVDLKKLEAQVQQRANTIEVGSVPTVLSDAVSLLAIARAIQASLVSGVLLETAVTTDCSQRAKSLETLATTGHKQAETLVTTLGAEADERQKTLQEQAARLADIEARLKLAEQLPQIEKYVARLKWVTKAGTVLSIFQGLLRGLTTISKTASEDLVNQDFERLFKEECKALRAPEVKLDFPGREGQAKRRKTLVKDHALSEILSEGEQKAIALADFLAEAGLPNLIAPIVFDDPVNSLDYKRLRYVVDRIVALSEERQIVVFTHNIWFTAELLNRFEKAPPQDCKVLRNFI